MMNVAKRGAVLASRCSGARGWIECLLLALGLGLLLLYLAAWIHAAVMSRASLWSFDALQSAPSMAEEQKNQTRGDGRAFRLWSGKRVSAYTKASAARLSPPLAVLSIRRLGLEVPVFDGTDRITLNRGAGRIVGTARPGEQGNIGIAAHRDGFFRGLKDVQMGDQIELAIPWQRFVYTVDDIRIVRPSDVSVLRARPRPSLTLVTCYPFYFVGDAPKRYVVQASLTNSEQLDPTFPNMNKKEKTQ